MSEDELVQFKLSYDPGEVTVLKSVLEDQGIPYFIQGENFAMLYPSTMPFMSGVRIKVRREDAERTQQLIDKLAEKIEPLDEDEWDE